MNKQMPVSLHAHGRDGPNVDSALSMVSCRTHYKEAECLRQMVEPFLYNAGVDIVMHGQSPPPLPPPKPCDSARASCKWRHNIHWLSNHLVWTGHVHAYERTYQVLNYQTDGCAPRWLTMGIVPKFTST
jgi:hypothetical protein